MNKLSFNGIYCVQRCSDINEAYVENNNIQTKKCYKCVHKVNKIDDDHCISLQKLSAMKICGTNARPDPNNLETACVCNDSSLVLQPDLINCKCPSLKYFNEIKKTCLSCPSGSSSNTQQTFCFKDSTYYFDLATEKFVSCPDTLSASSATQNLCICTSLSKVYVGDLCLPCPSPATRSTDKTSCVCASGKRFDEISGTCQNCGAAFTSSQIFNDRRICTCAAGQVNIGNFSCSSCTQQSTYLQPGLVNVLGCQCNDNKYFWSAQNNSCTLCPYGTSNSTNQCNCPAQISQVNAQNKSCICYGNFRYANLQCIACPATATASSDSTTCICPNNQYFSDSTNICNPCPTNSVGSNNVCTCNSNSIQISTNGQLPVCQLCPSQSSPNNLQTTCICAESNKFYTKSNNSCTSCPDQSSIVNGVCTCNSDCIKVMDFCRKCPSFSIVYGTICQCSGNYIFDINNMVCVACPFGSVLNYNNKCICSLSQQSIINEVCTTCPSGSNPSTSGQSCTCVTNQIFNIKTMSCQTCPGSSILSGDKSICICTSQLNYIIDTNICQPCPQYSSCNVNNICVCSNTNQFMKNQICTNCPANSIPSADQYSCICTGQFTFNGINCIACPQNSMQYGGVCVCNTGLYLSLSTCLTCPPSMEPNQIRTSCVCSGNSINKLGQCISCPAQSTSFNGFCRANPGCYSVDNITFNYCPVRGSPNEQQTTCVCSGDYVFEIINNICTPCAQGSIALNNKCVCQGNSVQDGNNCKLCPSNALPNTDRTLCVCNNGQIINIAKNICESFCSSGYLNVAKTACVVDCKTNDYPNLLGLDKISCVSSCVSSVINTAQKACIVSCSSEGSFLKNVGGACATDCSDGGYENADRTICVTNCFNDDSNRALDITRKKCQSICSPGFKKNNETHCVAYCSMDTGYPIINIILNKCVSQCSGLYLTINGSLCVDDCKTKDPGTKIDIAQLNCVDSCTGSYINVDQSKCVLSCYLNDGGSAINTDNLNCIQTCKSGTYLSFNRSNCVDSCYLNDVQRTIDLAGTKCLDTCEPNSYLAVNNSKCVASCYLDDGSRAIDKDHKKCVMPCDSGSYLTVNRSQCVADCYTEDIDPTTHIGAVIHTDLLNCTIACPINSYRTINESFCVTDCFAQDQSHPLNVEKTHCVSVCAASSFLTRNGSFCVADCKTEDTINLNASYINALNTTCVDQCAPGTYLNEAQTRCVQNCTTQDGGKLLNLAGTACESLCTTGYANVARTKCVVDCKTDDSSVIDLDRKTCTSLCTPQTSFLTNNGSLCVSDCFTEDNIAPTYINAENTTCVLGCRSTTFMSGVNKRCVFNCTSEDSGRLTSLAENSCEQICSNGYANVARLKCVDALKTVIMKIAIACQASINRFALLLVLKVRIKMDIKQMTPLCALRAAMMTIITTF
ncbi:Conserved_hypothetical protein [Hexamita inflata]|uniref:Uncharacterized protein n=1 Tax=Hexamita inflata TaxID=28002 RepID=A0AA86UC09_9EUKA|nr:Conserved hypothetical protein [Hexamita inflata]